MKPIELGTFALLVIFVAGMTMKHNEQVKEDQQAAQTLEQVRIKQTRDKEANTMATKATVKHDNNSSTSTVIVSLNASSSFDGGNVADQVYFNRYVPDKTKPICAEYEKNCTPRMGRGCECVEIQLDECGDEMYEPLCTKYQEGCDASKDYNNIYRGNMGNIGGANDCRCVEYLEVLVEYVDDCEYQVVPDMQREAYLKAHMWNSSMQYEADGGLTYSWEQVSGPSSDVQKYSKNASMELTLGEGEYAFRCTVTDKYGARDAATHRVLVSKEANNPPEANITGKVLLKKSK